MVRSDENAARLYKRWRLFFLYFLTRFCSCRLIQSLGEVPNACEIKRSFGGDAASLNMPAMPNIETCELMQLRKPDPFSGG